MPRLTLSVLQVKPEWEVLTAWLSAQHPHRALGFAFRLTNNNSMVPAGCVPRLHFRCAARSRSVPPGPRRLFFGGVPAALPLHSFALGRCGEVWAPRSPGRDGRDARWCCPPPRPRPVFPSFVSAACAALARVFRHSFPRMCERAPPPAGPSPLFVLVVPGFEGRDGWLKCED